MNKYTVRDGKIGDIGSFSMEASSFSQVVRYCKGEGMNRLPHTLGPIVGILRQAGEVVDRRVLQVRIG